jgi:Pvc16 N-terminal domain
MHDGQMLRDADRSLANWLGTLLPPGVGLRFDPPDHRWLSQPPEPLFLSAFLHTVRQDPRGRQSGWSDLREPDGRVVGRQAAPPHYRLGYLITAWAAEQVADSPSDRAMAEHEVLGLVVDGSASHGVLPEDCLSGALAEAAARIVLECGAADSPAIATATWAGLGIGPRAHLELALVAPARSVVLTDIAPPAREIVLNAGQRPTTSATPATAPEREAAAVRPFGTLRRWEKRTITEPASAPDPG